MLMKTARQIVIEHQAVVDRICDLFEEEGVEPYDAEILMAWIIGISNGHRGGSLLMNEITRTMALGWKFAVEDQQ